MSRRIRRVVALIASIFAVSALLKFTVVAGQAPGDKAGAGAKPGPAPKTSWGEPDLQGIWTNLYETPLQRPARYASKEVLTDEEREAQDKQRASALGLDRRQSRGSEQDVAGAYNTAIFLSHKPT